MASSKTLPDYLKNIFDNQVTSCFNKKQEIYNPWNPAKHGYEKALQNYITHMTALYKELWEVNGDPHFDPKRYSVFSRTFKRNTHMAFIPQNMYAMIVLPYLGEV